jgi:hypothetical protein
MRAQFYSICDEFLLQAMRQHCPIVAVRQFDLNEIPVWNPPRFRISRPGSAAYKIGRPFQVVVQDGGEVERLKLMVVEAEKLPRYWLEAIYPFAMVWKYRGPFPLHTARQWCCKYYGMQHPSADERQLEPGGFMQADKYLFQRQDHAEEAFEYAKQRFSGWSDTFVGEQYLLKLCIDRLISHLDKIGESKRAQVAAQP